MVATFPGNANYEAGSATATLTITKSTVDIQINVNDAIYDGQPHPAGVTVSGVHPDFFAPDSVTYNGSTDNPVNAGTYTVVATFNGTAIYEAATASRTLIIRKATPTVTVNGGTFTYNGQPHPATGSVTGIGEAPIGTPTFTYNGGAALPVTVGTYEVVAPTQEARTTSQPPRRRRSRSCKRRQSWTGLCRKPSSMERPSDRRSSTRRRTCLARSRIRRPRARC